MASLANLQREITSLGRRARGMGNARVTSPAPAGSNLGLARAIGQRVLDLVTGEEGVIVDGTAEHIIVRAAGK